MFRLEVLPARYGDCLWLEYGSNPVRRMLIDGGAPGVYKKALKPRLKRLSDEEREFELLARMFHPFLNLAGDMAKLGWFALTGNQTSIKP